MANTKTLYTTESLFKTIMDQLKDAGKVPEDIVDYALGPSNPRELRDYEFEVLGRVNYGGSEGIYVDLYFEGNIGDGWERRKSIGDIGTIKTLETSDEAFHKMATLMADFQIAASRFINQHLDDFTHVGYDMHFFRADGSEYGCGYTYKWISSFAEAEKEAEKHMADTNQRYAADQSKQLVSCRIIENKTGKEETVLKNGAVQQ